MLNGKANTLPNEKIHRKTTRTLVRRNVTTNLYLNLSRIAKYLSTLIAVIVKSEVKIKRINITPDTVRTWQYSSASPSMKNSIVATKTGWPKKPTATSLNAKLVSKRYEGVCKEGVVRIATMINVLATAVGTAKMELLTHNER